MHVRLLNGFAVTDGEAELDIGGRKPRTLLALLASHAPETVSVDRCIQSIWGEDAPAGAKRSLQTYVSSLRAVIDPDKRGRLEGSDNGYRLVMFDGDTRDVDEFRHLVSAAGDETPDELTGRLTQAPGLWTESPLGDLSHDDWAQPLLRGWTAERLGAVETWTDAHLAAGNPGAVVADLERIVGDHPLHEGLTARLMTALYQSGRQTEALDRYATLANRIGEELGLEPSPDLQTLEERILLHDPTLQPRRPTPDNLPEEVRPFVGRASDSRRRYRRGCSPAWEASSNSGWAGSRTPSTTSMRQSPYGHRSATPAMKAGRCSTGVALPGDPAPPMRALPPSIEPADSTRPPAIPSGSGSPS